MYIQSKWYQNSVQKKENTLKIERVIGREIFDSRGCPTIECQLVLEDGTVVISSVPVGASKGKHEAVELRDGGKRLMGLGVTKAVEHLEHTIAPILLRKEPDLVSMDIQMLELDGTTDKSTLGANTILAASVAVLKAQAISEGLEAYELMAHICGYESISLPLPMFNMINGGMHANNNLQIQEFLVVPVDMPSFRSAYEAAITFFHELKELLSSTNKSLCLGDEGGFASNFTSETEALDFLMEAMEKCKKKVKGSFVFALDVAASHFYDAKKKKYKWHGKMVSADQMIDYYEDLIGKYPLYAIEDGLNEDDIDGWKAMMQSLGSKIHLIGDDLFVTSAERIWQGIEQGWASAAIIKPNQVGTVTETLQAIKLCKEYAMNVIVSHRSGETEDTFITDLAVGLSVNHIKAGGCGRGERVAKYNRLLRIEDSLMLTLLGAQ